jgi:hypothetical protein
MGSPRIDYEAGQTAHPFEALTDSGDMTAFSASFSPWSDAAGAEPVVAPYGLLTGGAVTPTATNNQVSVAALTASMAGVAGADAHGVISVSSGTLLATRGTDTNPYRITSLTVDSDGDLAAIAGTAGTSFSEDRGANGGPPFIPVGSIEIGQVHLTDDTAAAVLPGEIYTVAGLHVERADFPVWQIDYALGHVIFAEPLPAIHTGNEPKKVYARGSTPMFSPIPETSDWTPAEATYSVSSTDTYDGPRGSASSSLGQASFTALLRDGITDNFIAQRGKNIWVRFRPDRDKMVPYQLTQGILGVSREFPAGGGNFSASCTLTPRAESVDVKE